MHAPAQEPPVRCWIANGKIEQRQKDKRKPVLREKQPVSDRGKWQKLRRDKSGRTVKHKKDTYDTKNDSNHGWRSERSYRTKKANRKMWARRVLNRQGRRHPRQSLERRLAEQGL